MISLDLPTVLLQWAVGGLFFTWITTRHREVGLGYGWLMRLNFLVLAIGSVVSATFFEVEPAREAATIGLIIATTIALIVSVLRKRAGVAGQRERIEKRSQRVADMTGIDKEEQVFDKTAAEFPPWLDLVGPMIGIIGLVAGGVAAGGPTGLSIARVIVGAFFLGAISDAMLLGHWYLVQPGLERGLLLELVRWTAFLWPFELLVLLWPTGMISVLNGSIADGYNGLLGWFWVASAAATIILLGVTRAALKERQYSAVMAATGLLYLAILTAFGMDLVARATLARDLVG